MIAPSDPFWRQCIYSATMQTLMDIRKATPLQEDQRKAELIDRTIRGLGIAISEAE